MRSFIVLLISLSSQFASAQDIEIQLNDARMDQFIVQDLDVPQLNISRVQLRELGFANYAYAWSPGGNANAQLIDYLAFEHTRKQLEFSDAQTKQFKELQKHYSQAYQKMYDKFPELKQKDIPKEARKELNRKVQLASEKLRKEFSEKVKETLIPQQVNLLTTLRFKQLVQMYGFVHAVSNAPISDQIKTTDEQKKKLASIRKETEDAIQKKIAEMRAEAKAKMLKVFDAKQRKKLKEIEGKNSTSPKL